MGIKYGYKLEHKALINIDTADKFCKSDFTLRLVTFIKYFLKIISIFFISSILLGAANQSQAQTEDPIHFKELTIVISSCDKYQEFWLPFFTFLFKNWPSLKSENKHIPILLITNEKNYPDPRVTVIQTGKDKSWSLNM